MAYGALVWPQCSSCSGLDGDFEMIANTIPATFWNNYSLGALFSDTPTARIIQLLSMYPATCYALDEITSQARIEFWRVHHPVQTLTNLDLVKTSRVGKTKLYQWNNESPMAKLIEKLSLEVAVKKFIAEKSAKEATMT